MTIIPPKRSTDTEESKEYSNRKYLVNLALEVRQLRNQVEMLTVLLEALVQQYRGQKNRGKRIEELSDTQQVE